MEALRSTQAFFLEPIKHSATALTKDDPTCGESIVARLCFLAQIISSVIAIPVLLLVGLATAAVRLFQGENVCRAFEQLGTAYKNTVLFSIPVSFVGIFAPLTTTRDLAKSMEECLVLHPVHPTA